MIKVAVEVRSGTARFRVAVQAENIQRALSLVTTLYPAGICRVKFPVEPEGFLVEGADARAEMVEQSKELAA